MTKTINLEATKTDAELIRKAVKRVAKKYKEIHSQDVDIISLEMDITAVHLNDCELDLIKLSEFEDFNLMHDVIGISNHIDRRTGKLTDCFLPRCSK